tara:strand:- start:400 stop:609 length:210 start_codon:yes stop_codon:yes gene_type:complete
MPVKYEMNEVSDNELYNLKNDPGEQYNLYNEKIEIVKKLEDIGEKARKELGDKLTSRIGEGVRKIGMIY